MKKARIYISYIAGVLTALCIVAGFLITSVEAVCYWMPGYFFNEYEKHQVLEDVDMEMEDLLTVTDGMMAYLRGDREELQVVTTIEGRMQPFFNQREISHMEDVRTLFVGGIWLRRGCLVFGGLLVLMIWKAGGLRLLPQAICAGTGVVFGGGALLALAVSRDFNRYFTLFHHIFFDNDLWLLDPDTDRLISIVPQGFFIDTALWIAVVFGALTALLLGGSVLAMALMRKRPLRSGETRGCRNL